MRQGEQVRLVTANGGVGEYLIEMVNYDWLIAIRSYYVSRYIPSNSHKTAKCLDIYVYILRLLQK